MSSMSIVPRLGHAQNLSFKPDTETLVFASLLMSAWCVREEYRARQWLRDFVSS
jgi:hypothetical protein